MAAGAARGGGAGGGGAATAGGGAGAAVDDTPPQTADFASAPGRLRDALHHHAKGVAVITVAAGPDGGGPAGFAATSLAPVSFDPPLLSFAVAKDSSSWTRLAVADHAMVHLLADDQEELARRFGTRGAPRFGPATRWQPGVHGLPVLEDALAWLQLALLERVEVDGHALVIGRVVAVRESGVVGKGPLLHYSGRYGQLARHPHHCGCPVG